MHSGMIDLRCLKAPRIKTRWEVLKAGIARKITMWKIQWAVRKLTRSAVRKQRDYSAMQKRVGAGLAQKYKGL